MTEIDQFDYLLNQDKKFSEDIDYLDSNSNQSLKIYESLERNIKKYLENCILFLRQTRSIDHYSLICSIVSKWANFILSNTSKIVKFTIPLPNNIPKDNYFELDKVLKNAGVSFMEYNETKTARVKYLRNSERRSIYEIWIYSKVNYFIPNIQTFRILIAQFSITTSNIKAHIWDSNIKKPISGNSILEKDDKNIFLNIHHEIRSR